MPKPWSQTERPSEMFRFVRLAAVTAAATLALTACSASAGAPSADQRTITRAPTGPSATAESPIAPTASPKPPPPPVAPVGGSGVQGSTVTRRCPVETEPPCVATPVSTHIVVTDANTTVATVDTGANGRFQIALKPGHYTVTATAIGTPIVRPASTTVTVIAGRYAPLTLMMDSGIR
jgi:hypothetical protein